MAPRYGKLDDERERDVELGSFQKTSSFDEDGSSFDSEKLLRPTTGANDSEDNGKEKSDESDIKSTRKERKRQRQRILQLLYPERWRMSIAFVFLAIASLTQVRFKTITMIKIEYERERVGFIHQMQEVG